MTVALFALPTPTTRPATLNVVGTGDVPGAWRRLQRDGKSTSPITRFQVDRDGGFSVGLTVAASLVVGQHSVRLTTDSATGQVLATANYIVAAAAPPPPPPPPPSPTTGRFDLSTIQGFGAIATGGEGKPIVEFHDYASLKAALAAGNAYIIPAAGFNGSIAFPEFVNPGSNLTLDGQGRLTITGHTLYLKDNIQNVGLTGFRHRGGWAGGQDGDCITITRGCKRIFVDHLSLSGHSDEGLDLWRANEDVTVQWVLIGEGMDPNHNFPMFTDGSRRISFHHNLLYRGIYRNPAVGYDIDENGATPTEITADVVNNLVVLPSGANIFGTTVYRKAWANVVANYYLGQGDALDIGGDTQTYTSGNLQNGQPVSSSNRSTPHAVRANAVIAATDARTAAIAVRANAGCFPRDAADAARVAGIVIA